MDPTIPSPELVAAIKDAEDPAGGPTGNEIMEAANAAAVTGDRSALDRLEAVVRQATLGSAKGPRPTPPAQSPRKKARIAAREARRLNRKR